MSIITISWVYEDTEKQLKRVSVAVQWKILLKSLDWFNKKHHQVFSIDLDDASSYMHLHMINSSMVNSDSGYREQTCPM